MFEVPSMYGPEKALPCAVGEDLVIAGHLCADVAQAFRMAETLFSEARVSSERLRLAGRSSVGSFDYWYRRITEAARFREGIALLYLDTAFGYCVAARRVLSALRRGDEVSADLVSTAMEEGASLPVAHELTAEFAFPRNGTSAHDRRLEETHGAVRVDIMWALQTVESENSDTLHKLLADAGTDAGEAVVQCLAAVNSHAEALHFTICNDVTSGRAAALSSGR